MRIVFFTLLLLSCYSRLPAQEGMFGNIYTGLDELETLMSDIESRNETLMKESETLSGNLKRVEGDLSSAREQFERQSVLLSGLRGDLNQMSEAYKRQSGLLEVSERKSRNWRLAFWIGLPTAAGVTALLMAIVN